MHYSDFFYKILHQLDCAKINPVGYIFTALKEEEFNILSAWYINISTSPIHKTSLPPSTFSNDWKGVRRDLQSSSNFTGNYLLQFELPLYVHVFIINLDIFLRFVLARAWETVRQHYCTIEEILNNQLHRHSHDIMERPRSSPLECLPFKWRSCLVVATISM